MDIRAAKLALARKKLKDHQEKKLVSLPKDVNDYAQHDNIIQEPIMKNQDPVISMNEHENVNNSSVEINEIGNLDEDQSTKNVYATDSHVNITEILISNKTTLELQLSELQSKLLQLQHSLTLEINNHNVSKQKIINLENELKNIHHKYLSVTEDNISKDNKIKELNTVYLSLLDENSNFVEQLEFTKTVLTSKETENASLQSQLSHLQNKLDAMQLQLQQLTNGSPVYLSQTSEQNSHSEKNEALLQKIANLEQQLTILQKERDQINMHYEHYVGELNEQLRAVTIKNEKFAKEIHDLSNRENSLIDQISEMEIRLQNYHTTKEAINNKNVDNDTVISELQQKFVNAQKTINELTTKYEELQKIYLESDMKVKELTQEKETKCDHDNISITKLNADITSDKIAVQRATEQNKKLKADVQDLEEAFIKMSRDKLELTEKLTAEKYLNRELTLKLAEVEEKAKDMLIKLMAKDEEMIRLQTNYRDIERKFEQLSTDIKQSKEDTYTVKTKEVECEYTELNEEEKTNIHSIAIPESENKPLIVHEKKGFNIPKEDAMVKLQERFLKIMEEVADLSDEKHRLEHIILQLQNETDTICEYVALYQQQRSLLKKRDEERSAQIKLFQSECDCLKSQLEELSGILVRFAEDKELSSYFQVESKHKDITNVLNLLSNLKNNTLVDPKKKNLEFKNFYPCNCCSGQLIDV